MLDCLYKAIVKPALFGMEPETAHDLVQRLSRGNKLLWSCLRPALRYGAEDLKCSIAKTQLHNPVGVAAGFDKNAYLVDVLGDWGFGFAEIGSITARASLGNPKPRLFRLPEDQALVNRMGLNGEGAATVASRLSRSYLSLPVGINIAKTNDPGITGDAAIDDILTSFKCVKDLPVAFFTINASCPNTHEGIVEESRELSVIFEEIGKLNPAAVPVLVKLSPDSSQELIEDIVAEAIKFGVAGFVCGNTSTSRLNLHTSAARLNEIGNGGLSGAPLKPLALRLVSLVYKLKLPEQIIIGVGGMSTGDDAYEFVCSGASLVELYTAMIYGGPMVVKSVNTRLSKLLKRDGLSLKDAVGINHR